jgi:PIN domain nuclease of toxin-antitoxin system
MRLLLDTSTLLWWLIGNEALSPTAREAIADPANEVFISAVLAWEIATKYRLGRLPEAALVAADIVGTIAEQGFTELPITLHHGQVAGSLPALHADPFDRMLVAQAMLTDMAIVSNDEILSAYGVARLW